MFEKLKKTVALILGITGRKELPITDGKVNFPEEEKEKLVAALGMETYGQVIEAIEKEVETAAISDNDLAELKKEIKAVMAEEGVPNEEQDEILDGKGEGDADLSATVKNLIGEFKTLKEANAQQKALIEKLSGVAENGNGIQIKKNMNGKFEHSATHLFGISENYFALDRPWNRRFAEGGKATDFSSDVTVPLLKGDLEHFIRTNPGAIENLFNDTESLPAEWDSITGIADQYTTAGVIPSEVLQGRSKGWNPKGKIGITAETLKVYAKKIDITFDGQELQDLENKWIAEVKNLDGSHPYKMSFIYWVLSHLILAVKRDERVAMVNGIFVQTPDGDDYVGQAVNSQNGLRWFWWYYRDVVKKYQPFVLGAPQAVGFVDYIRTMIERIPEIDRKEFGWEIQLSEKWYKVYQKEAGEIYSLKYHTDLGKKDYPLDYPIDYPNFKFQVLKDQTNTNFIGIVKSLNVKKLDFKPEEKNILTMTQEKRNTHFFGDYKSGIGFGAVGIKLEDGDYGFERQLLYSNDCPIFDNSVSIPAFDDKTGVLKLNYTNVKIDHRFTTDITNLKGLEDIPFPVDLKGKVIRIIGNANLASEVKVKHNSTKIKLASNADFNLKSGGTLTLFANQDGTFTELSRTSEPEAPVSNVVKFTDVAIDANDGTEFLFEGSSAKTLNSIINGIEGKVITIKSGNTSGLTLATGHETIKVNTNAVLDAVGDSITLVYAGGVWYETSRNIAS